VGADGYFECTLPTVEESAQKFVKPMNPFAALQCPNSSTGRA